MARTKTEAKMAHFRSVDERAGRISDIFNRITPQRLNSPAAPVAAVPVPRLSTPVAPVHLYLPRTLNLLLAHWPRIKWTAAERSPTIRLKIIRSNAEITSDPIPVMMRNFGREPCRIMNFSGRLFR